MIKIENYEVVGWEHAIRGMRNPKNSWERSDSEFKAIAKTQCLENDIVKVLYVPYDALSIGDNDHKLMMNLAAGGPVHAKYRRFIDVYLDITAPLYWWKEFDTYKVGTAANSCSTMHKIHDKEFTLEDFSLEHLIVYNEDIINYTIDRLNVMRDVFLNGGYIPETPSRDMVFEPRNKLVWWQMIQLLPSSYNQKRTVKLNYEVLANIYESRKDHKLDEWREFCKWIEELPYSEIITGERDG